jgi:hypothetical protein
MISNGPLDGEMYGVSPFQQVNKNTKKLSFYFNKISFREEHL